ncbi:MAG TPA: hypothetical protein DCZ01_09625 [Elusimicrobia bacterium]|nr:MAG: hypothetical protein A2X37_11595 [Elusimicrobia bacterium GWA2_66_18]OGR74106.1 MAG: hypothetical protein A2X40_03010 [Elusimicrobia bacterium GWC2_65_9]HAZ08758.1 hypothetical protein [Elusimicrobiota bacterium]
MAIDPAPTLPDLAATAPAVSPEPALAPAPSPATPVSAAAASNPAAESPSVQTVKRRAWGRVSITTAVLSPSQLMGPDVPYSSAFMRLPVFPEKIVLQVSWGLLSVGEATLTVDKIVTFNGRPAYHIVSEARSNSFCDSFYPVRDLNESWLDARTLTSLGYSKKLREGRFFRDEWVLYDRDAGTFIARRTDRDGNFAVRTGTIPASVQDILSSVYFVRAQELKNGDQVVVDVNTPDNWPLVVKVTSREQVETPAGRFSSVLVEPAMRREGLFVQKGKRLRLWLSDDAARRPLLMKVEVFFGHVTAVVREMI